MTTAALPQRAIRAGRLARLASDPGYRDRINARQNRYLRERRRSDPQWREAQTAYKRRWRAEKRKDPAYVEAERAGRRDYYERKKAERQAG